MPKPVVLGRIEFFEKRSSSREKIEQEQASPKAHSRPRRFLSTTFLMPNQENTVPLDEHLQLLETHNKLREAYEDQQQLLEAVKEKLEQQNAVHAAGEVKQPQKTHHTAIKEEYKLEESQELSVHEGEPEIIIITPAAQPDEVEPENRQETFEETVEILREIEEVESTNDNGLNEVKDIRDIISEETQQAAEAGEETTKEVKQEEIVEIQDAAEAVKDAEAAEEVKVVEEVAFKGVKISEEAKRRKKNKISKRGGNAFSLGSKTVRASNDEISVRPKEAEEVISQPILHVKERKKRELIFDKGIRERQAAERKGSLQNKYHLQRMSILQEMIDTEIDYIEILITLRSVRDWLLVKKKISPEEAEQLFSNIHILESNHKQLAIDLQSRFTESDKSQCWNISVGDIFLILSVHLQSYAAYTNNQDMQNKLAHTLTQKRSFNNSVWRSGLLKDCQAKNFVGGQLQSKLIVPVQRLCKYPLLLRELIEATEEEHEDRATLLLALKKIQRAATAVNIKKKESEQDRMMKEVEMRLESVPKSFLLNNYSRVCLRESDLSQYMKGKLTERKFYLFDDIIILGTPKGSGKVVWKAKLSFADSMVFANLFDTGSLQNAFEITCATNRKRKYIFATRSYPEKVELVNIIEERLTHFRFHSQQLALQSP